MTFLLPLWRGLEYIGVIMSYINSPFCLSDALGTSGILLGVSLTSESDYSKPGKFVRQDRLDSFFGGLTCWRNSPRVFSIRSFSSLGARLWPLSERHGQIWERAKLGKRGPQQWASNQNKLGYPPWHKKFPCHYLAHWETCRPHSMRNLVPHHVIFFFFLTFFQRNKSKAKKRFAQIYSICINYLACKINFWGFLPKTLKWNLLSRFKIAIKILSSFICFRNCNENLYTQLIE